ncbi:hypothetical protein RRG08_024849 [Elysia crispata]|uniref:Uncharacterized protein n=1 Tax=Elysia crispata TaxID=231223 RepID=A0AAE0YJ08_9GAST|nr:hypothetical protein RRG08_024849 [Elysia crispata]
MTYSGIREQQRVPSSTRSHDLLAVSTIFDQTLPAGSLCRFHHSVTFGFLCSNSCEMSLTCLDSAGAKGLDDQCSLPVGCRVTIQFYACCDDGRVDIRLVLETEGELRLLGVFCIIPGSSAVLSVAGFMTDNPGDHRGLRLVILLCLLA